MTPPSKSKTAPADVIVIGAGMIGLTTGILLARSGHRVTVLERDPAPVPGASGDPWTSWDRPGVNQFRHPHLVLPRWHHLMDTEIPGLADDLLAAGAGRVNLLHQQPESATHGWQPGDEQFDTVTARRPVLEAVLARRALAEPGMTVRRGVGVSGLLLDRGPGPMRVGGVRTPYGDLIAGLVVDASGRRTRVPRLLAAAGATAPTETNDDAGFIYYSRHFRATDGRMPTGAGLVLTHHPSLSVLTFPCDNNTFCVVLATCSADRQLRALRDPAAWGAVARRCPTIAPWLAGGTPLTPVTPLSGIHDVFRNYVRGGEPVVDGLVAIGDSAAATNPSLGRGITIGALQATVLRDVLIDAPSDPGELAAVFAEAIGRRVQPWIDLTSRFDRHRLGEMRAEIAESEYRTDDPTWPATTALLNGARRNPVLARASGRIASMLATPADIFPDPAVQRALGPFLGQPRYAAADLGRDGVLAAMSTVPLVAS